MSGASGRWWLRIASSMIARWTSGTNAITVIPTTDAPNAAITCQRCRRQARTSRASHPGFNSNLRLVGGGGDLGAQAFVEHLADGQQVVDEALRVGDPTDQWVELGQV